MLPNPHPSVLNDYQSGSSTPSNTPAQPQSQINLALNELQQPPAVKELTDNTSPAQPIPPGSNPSSTSPITPKSYFTAKPPPSIMEQPELSAEELQHIREEPRKSLANTSSSLQLGKLFTYILIGIILFAIGIGASYLISIFIL